MIRFRVLRVFLCLGLLACLLGAEAAQAGGPWSLRRGRVFTSWYYYNYYTPFAGDALSTAHGAGMYYEIGLGRRFTLQGTLPTAYQTYEQGEAFEESAGFGDAELGVRYELTQPGAGTSASLTLLGAAPWLYSTSANPLPGPGQAAMQLSGSLGTNFRGEDVSGWALIDGGYRAYLGEASDQVRGEALVGVHLTKRFDLITQLFGVYSLEEGTFEASAVNPNYPVGFSALKTQVTVVWRFSEQMALQGGYLRDLATSYGGTGQGMTLALWINI